MIWLFSTLILLHDSILQMYVTQKLDLQFSKNLVVMSVPVTQNIYIAARLQIMKR